MNDELPKKGNSHLAQAEKWPDSVSDSLKVDLVKVELETLVQRAQDQQPEAFLELIRCFVPLLSKWQRRLSEQMPYEDKEVLHSEVRFVFLLLVLEFDDAYGVPFEGYVCHMIARRLTDNIKAARRFRAIPFSEVAALLGLEISNVPECLHTSFLPEDCWCSLWWQETISHLTPRQRTVMKLILQGLTEREIAAVLGVQQETVHQSKHEARKKLQEFWR